MKKILFLFLILSSLSSMVHGKLILNPPVLISSGLSNASDPQVVIDGAGNASAVWVENNSIMYSNLSLEGVWSAPGSLSVGTASTPKLAISANGDVTAVWIENSQIQSASKPAGGSWGTAVTISTNSLGQPASQPAVALADDGTAVAAWKLYSDDFGYIQASRRSLGNWDNTPTTLDQTLTSNHPAVAISNAPLFQGIAIVVWHSNTDDKDTLKSSSMMGTASGSWGSFKTIITDATSINDYPQVVLDTSGNATLVWFRYNSFDYNNVPCQKIRVYSSMLIGDQLQKDLNGWSTIQAISQLGIRDPADLMLKIKTDGYDNVVAAWTNSIDGMLFNVESAKKIGGEAKWRPFTMPFLPSLYSFGLDLASAAGTSLLTNMQWDGASTLNIQSQESVTENPTVQAWSPAYTISEGNSNANPSCGISFDGISYKGVAVWINYNGAFSVINASTGSFDAVLPPTNVNVIQEVTNFGVYTDYHNTITWTASLDPGVIEYNIFRNDIIIGTTDPLTLSFVDHNQLQEGDGSTTYGIAAVSSYYRQSQIIEKSI